VSAADKQKERNPGENLKGHCTAFCPKCGSDLHFYNSECFCKNPKCDWSCGGCRKYGTRQE
jgi:hypothetical protein